MPPARMVAIIDQPRHRLRIHHCDAPLGDALAALPFLAPLSLSTCRPSAPRSRTSTLTVGRGGARPTPRTTPPATSPIGAAGSSSGTRSRQPAFRLHVADCSDHRTYPFAFALATQFLEVGWPYVGHGHGTNGRPVDLCMRLGCGYEPASALMPTLVDPTTRAGSPCGSHPPRLLHSSRNAVHVFERLDVWGALRQPRGP
jgi:hypothetical protein